MEDVVRDGCPEDKDNNAGVEVPLVAFHPVLGSVNFSNVNMLSWGKDLTEATNTENGQVQTIEGGGEQTSAATPTTLHDNLGASETAARKVEINHAAKHIMVHGQEGPYLLRADKWPNLVESEPLAGESHLTQEGDLLEDEYIEEMDTNRG
jgi:hypothetical protein